MSLLAFLRSHAVRVVCSVLVLALLAAMLPVVGVERAAMELVVLLVAVLELVGLLWEWLRGRSFMRSLAGLAGGEEDVLDAVDTIPEPEYPEGELAWDALQSVAQASRRRSAGLEQEMREYRRYVELWVHEIKTPLAAMNLTLANSHRSWLMKITMVLVLLIAPVSLRSACDMRRAWRPTSRTRSTTRAAPRLPRTTFCAAATWPSLCGMP